jgi:beta-glucosidase/6-phospho-beta-glucosidase/beta-galactosidase
LSDWFITAAARRTPALRIRHLPERLTEYASAVAQRYPWIEYYTPVNEPLTTARFSGLYGVWYPHGSDERIFRLAGIKSKWTT